MLDLTPEFRKQDRDGLDPPGGGTDVLTGLQRLECKMTMKALYDKTTPQVLANRLTRSIEKKVFYDKITPQDLTNRITLSIEPARAPVRAEGDRRNKYSWRRTNLRRNCSTDQNCKRFVLEDLLETAPQSRKRAGS